ncbi:MAG TPA: phosphatidylinositol mannoside acyltransferase [Actinomycetaceae bacterium]|nr:phosphatidylinositol mannoside acyltransferase [Actinomycetaceae bacterium]
MPVDLGRVAVAAWDLIPKMPEGLVRGAFDIGFRAAARMNKGGTAQLRANLARVRPRASTAELDRLAREGMREYGRYYAETFMLAKFATPEKLADRVRAIHTETSEEDLRTRSVVLALGHTGNWDIAGAWVTAHLNTVLTVAEKLKPESLFRAFLDFRESLGMEVIPLEKGQNVFRKLLSRSIAGKRVVALLADRDLTRGGIEVRLAGEPALFAVGPAALSLKGKMPLYFVGIRSDRITGRDGRKRWGIELEFRGPITLPDDVEGNEVAALTQAWVDELTDYITTHPTSWHLLQKVFVADLDPERLARRASAN